MGFTADLTSKLRKTGREDLLGYPKKEFSRYQNTTALSFRTESHWGQAGPELQNALTRKTGHREARVHKRTNKQSLQRRRRLAVCVTDGAELGQQP